MFRLTWGSIAPYSLSRGNPLKFTSFLNIHSWICAARRLHARTSVTSYTSVNIYNFNSRLAHFNALWMEYIRSLRTGIMAEYPVMSTSQGTCVRIEQTSEAIRVTYEICREDARTGIENCWSSQISMRRRLGFKSNFAYQHTKNTCIYTYKHSHIHINFYAYTLLNTRTYIYTSKHSHIHIHFHAYTPINTRIYI